MIPQKFDVNMCTGFQIWQFSVMYKKKKKKKKETKQVSVENSL